MLLRSAVVLSNAVGVPPAGRDALVFSAVVVLLADAALGALASTVAFGGDGALEIWDGLKASSIVVIAGGLSLRSKVIGPVVYGLVLGLLSIAPWVPWADSLIGLILDEDQQAAYGSVAGLPGRAWVPLATLAVVSLGGWAIGFLTTRPPGPLRRARWIVLAGMVVMLEVMALRASSELRAVGSPGLDVGYRVLVSLAVAYMIALLTAAMQAPAVTRR